MNALSSPLEFVAFDYFVNDVSTVHVTNLWTWLAVFCAGAASFFWRAKSPVTLLASPEPEVPVSSSSPSFLRSTPCEPDKHQVISEPSYERALESSTDGITKGKFVAYYYSENICDEPEYEFGDGDGEGHAKLLRKFNFDKLEKINEMGWYCYQDLTVLSGDIVRLWDGRVL